MTYKVRRASKITNKILRALLNRYLNRHFNVECDIKGLEGLKPPYVILANHVTNWDPFILSLKIPEPVHFVASAEQFRHPVKRLLMRLAGSIPKTKSMSDASSVKAMYKLRDMGCIVGVFPEGLRCWDGKTADILFPTAKLIKGLKIPVISVLFQGGYLSQPRWALSHRLGVMKLKYRPLFSREEVMSLPVDEIYNKIGSALYQNDYTWQKENYIPYKGEKLAESLEIVLFLCPVCHTMSKLVSHDDTFTCTACGEKLRMNEYGFFEKEQGSPVFETVHEWNQWQLKELEKIVAERLKNNQEPIFHDKNLFLLTGTRFSTLKRISRGDATLYSDRIVFEPYGARNTITYPLSELNGVSTHLKYGLDLYHKGEFFRISFKKSNVSANKWTEAYDIIKKINPSVES